MTKRRWLVYLAIGALFGVFDFYYLTLLARFAGPLLSSGPAGAIAWLVLNLGVWLVPVVPIALYEARRSRARLRCALASLAAWCAAIVAYYLTNAVQLAFVGVPGRPELHISNRSAPHFWQNWAFVLRRNILAGITEWMVVAVVGGAIVGLAVGSLYLLCRPSPQGTSARHDAGVTA